MERKFEWLTMVFHIFEELYTHGIEYCYNIYSFWVPWAMLYCCQNWRTSPDTLPFV